MKFFLLLSLLLACDNVGYVTGSAVSECGSFGPGDTAYIEDQLVLLVCPKLKKHLEGRECTANLLRETLNSIQLDFLGGGLDYCVWFEPLEETR